jgi:uncharacterized protein
VLITPRELEIHRIVISKAYAPGELNYHGAEFRQVIPLRVNAVAELVAKEINIRGRLETKLEAVCDRCLGPAEIRVDRNFDLFYRPMSAIARDAEEVEIPRDDLEVGFYSGEGVELADILTEQVILSVPMKVICTPDCQGLCPICGANRNFEDCHCSTQTVNPPFISLEE